MNDYVRIVENTLYEAEQESDRITLSDHDPRFSHFSVDISTGTIECVRVKAEKGVLQDISAMLDSVGLPQLEGRYTAYEADSLFEGLNVPVAHLDGDSIEMNFFDARQYDSVEIGGDVFYPVEKMEFKPLNFPSYYDNSENQLERCRTPITYNIRCTNVRGRQFEVKSIDRDNNSQRILSDYNYRMRFVGNPKETIENLKKYGLVGNPEHI